MLLLFKKIFHEDFNLYSQLQLIILQRIDKNIKITTYYLSFDGVIIFEKF